MEFIKPSGQDVLGMADVATAEAAQILVPKYDFFQKDPYVALKTGVGDCKAVALITVAMRPDLAFIKHVTKSTKGHQRTTAAYVHYLAVDRSSGVLIHSSGAPLTPEGAHIKALHISDFATGWNEAGEKRAKPSSALGALAKICDGSDFEERSLSEYKLSMKVENPQDYLKLGTMQDLRDEAIQRLPVI